MDLRTAARTIFHDALQHTRVDVALRERLRCEAGLLEIAGENPPERVDLHRFTRILVVAVGKAAVPLADTLVGILEPAIADGQVVEGVVVGSALPRHPHPQLRYWVGGHPVPDAASADAARAVLALLSTASEETLVLYLLSGGASAMLELPIDPAVSPAEMSTLHRALVHSGLPIAAMNTLRKHVSAVKGGRLALAAAGARQITLLVSDVRPEMPEVVGSGPSLPDVSTLSDCVSILERLPSGTLPVVLERGLRTGTLAETPKPGNPAFAHSSVYQLLSSEDLWRAAKVSAEALGFRVLVDNRCDEWPARKAAEHLLAALDAQKGPACVLSAGEISVEIQAKPGCGGRNQHFVLECARFLAQQGADATILSAGSDGADGNSGAAGGLVDGQTSVRAAAAGFSVAEALTRFDAFPLLHALRDTVVTGPTGNNLRDLRVLLRDR